MKSTRSISGWRYRVGLLVSMLLAMAACGEGDELGFSGSISLSANAVSATWITLSWSAPSGGVSVSPYVVARNDDQSGSSIGSTTSRTYEVAGLAPSTEYCFVIRNPLTGNTLSNKACATTLADTDAPSVPADLSVEPRSAAEIDLDWSLAGDNDRVTATTSSAMASFSLHRRLRDSPTQPHYPTPPTATEYRHSMVPVTSPLREMRPASLRRRTSSTRPSRRACRQPGPTTLDSQSYR